MDACFRSHCIVTTCWLHMQIYAGVSKNRTDVDFSIGVSHLQQIPASAFSIAGMSFYVLCYYSYMHLIRLPQPPSSPFPLLPHQDKASLGDTPDPDIIPCLYLHPAGNLKRCVSLKGYSPPICYPGTQVRTGSSFDLRLTGAMQSQLLQMGGATADAGLVDNGRHARASRWTGEVRDCGRSERWKGDQIQCHQV